MSNPFEEHIGDILSVKTGIVVQGCNAQGKMNSGLAKGLRAMYPGAFDVYAEEHAKHGLYVGQVVYYKVPLPAGSPVLVIANAITQKYYGRDKNVVYVDYDGLERCFVKIGNLAKDLGVPVHFPLIGAGLANGIWEDIVPRIDRALGPAIEKHLWRFPDDATEEQRKNGTLF